MTALAKVLGLEHRFYFYAYANADLANAGTLARAGEEGQFQKMTAQQDFLLLGDEWEQKRRARWHEGDQAYVDRLATLKQAFPATFEAMDAVGAMRANDLLPIIQQEPSMDPVRAVAKLREARIALLQDAFLREVLAAP